MRTSKSADPNSAENTGGALARADNEQNKLFSDV